MNLLYNIVFCLYFTYALKLHSGTGPRIASAGRPLRIGRSAWPGGHRGVGLSFWSEENTLGKPSYSNRLTFLVRWLSRWPRLGLRWTCRRRRFCCLCNCWLQLKVTSHEGMNHVVTTRLSQPTNSEMMKPTRKFVSLSIFTCGLLEINQQSEPKLPIFRGSGSEQQQRKEMPIQAN